MSMIRVDIIHTMGSLTTSRPIYRSINLIDMYPPLINLENVKTDENHPSLSMTSASSKAGEDLEDDCAMHPIPY